MRCGVWVGGLFVVAWVSVLVLAHTGHSNPHIFPPTHPIPTYSSSFEPATYQVRSPVLPNKHLEMLRAIVDRDFPSLRVAGSAVYEAGLGVHHCL